MGFGAATASPLAFRSGVGAANRSAKKPRLFIFPHPSGGFGGCKNTRRKPPHPSLLVPLLLALTRPLSPGHVPPLPDGRHGLKKGAHRRWASLSPFRLKRPLLVYKISLASKGRGGICCQQHVSPYHGRRLRHRYLNTLSGGPCRGKLNQETGSRASLLPSPKKA